MLFYTYFMWEKHENNFLLWKEIFKDKNIIAWESIYVKNKKFHFN